MALGIEARRIAFVAKHHIRMQIGIQIINTRVQTRNLALKRRDPLPARIIGAFPTRIIGAVTIHIHIGVLPAIAITMEEDCSVEIATVGE
jgi:hypothetical protein